MKKGLRQLETVKVAHFDYWETSPDEEGIKTAARCTGSDSGSHWETSPDEEGIKTSRSMKSCSSRTIGRQALMKKGLRHPHGGVVHLLVDSERSPDEVRD